MPASAYPNTNATSYTVGQYIEFAFRECGLLAEQQTPQYVQAAKQCLHHVLQDLSNRNELLFQWRYVLLGCRSGQRQLPLPAGTVDIIEANYRYPITPTPNTILPTDNSTAVNAFNKTITNNQATSTISENWLGAYYVNSFRVLHVGISGYAVSGTTTYSLSLDYSSDGINWATLQVLPTEKLNDGEWQYWQIDGCPTSGYSYWRVRNTDTAATFTIRQLVFGNVQQDIPLYRLNHADYMDLPNKDFQSNRALQYWYDRQASTPIINLWPVPLDDFQLFQFLLEAEMPDIGLLGDTLSIPNRWVHAVQSLLSHKLSMQLPGVDPNRITMLENAAKSNYSRAASEERDKARSNYIPRIGVYTR